MYFVCLFSLPVAVFLSEWHDWSFAQWHNDRRFGERILSSLTPAWSGQCQALAPGAESLTCATWMSPASVAPGFAISYIEVLALTREAFMSAGSNLSGSKRMDIDKRVIILGMVMDGLTVACGIGNIYNTLYSKEAIYVYLLINTYVHNMLYILTCVSFCLVASDSKGNMEHICTATVCPANAEGGDWTAKAYLPHVGPVPWSAGMLPTVDGCTMVV